MIKSLENMFNKSKIKIKPTSWHLRKQNNLSLSGRRSKRFHDTKAQTAVIHVEHCKQYFQDKIVPEKLLYS